MNGPYRERVMRYLEMTYPAWIDDVRSGGHDDDEAYRIFARGSLYRLLVLKYAMCDLIEVALVAPLARALRRVRG